MAAILLDEFVPESELLLVGEALMRMHFKYSDRKRRARARLKYVAQKLGSEGFIEEYRKQRAVIEKTRADDQAIQKPTGEHRQVNFLSLPMVWLSSTMANMPF